MRRGVCDDGAALADVRDGPRVHQRLPAHGVARARAAGRVRLQVGRDAVRAAEEDEYRLAGLHVGVAEGAA